MHRLDTVALLHSCFLFSALSRALDHIPNAFALAQVCHKTDLHLTVGARVRVCVCVHSFGWDTPPAARVTFFLGRRSGSVKTIFNRNEKRHSWACLSDADQGSGRIHHIGVLCNCRCRAENCSPPFRLFSMLGGQLPAHFVRRERPTCTLHVGAQLCWLKSLDYFWVFGSVGDSQ